MKKLRTIVSILVIMEINDLDAVKNALTDPWIQVSILVIMEINDLVKVNLMVFRTKFHVSILVIMEINDLGCIFNQFYFVIRSFNPCYNGN